MMQQPPKRQKLSTDSCIADIAICLESLAGTLKSIGQTHACFLKVNKHVVNYLLEEKKKAEAVNLEVSQRKPEEGSP